MALSLLFLFYRAHRRLFLKYRPFSLWMFGLLSLTFPLLPLEKHK